MDLLIRISDQAGGHSDSEHSSDRVMLGSATEADVQLPLLELRHASLEVNRKGLQIRGIGRGGLSVNGNDVRRAVLLPGDLIELPGASIHVEEPPQGFDAMINVKRAQGHVSSIASQKLSLADTFLGKRAFAWLGAVFVLVCMFALPLLFSGERAVDSPVQSLFSDHVWSSGELHAAHELVTGDNCAGCHTTPFERVQNDSCEACHGAIKDHVSGAFLAAAPATGDFGANANERCGVCHREHNEPSTLVSDADGDCVQCHGADQGIHRAIDPLAAVAGFAPDTHPSYEFMLPRFDLKDYAGGSDGGWRVEAVGDVELPNSPETSQLLFPHDLHLDATEVTDPASNEALSCGSCHSLAVDGEHYLPVSMEEHCQDCHQLDFDESDPDRSLPHARLREAVFALEGMLLKKYFDPDDTGELFAYRKLPDRPDRSMGCTDAPEVCVERELTQVVEAQFTGDAGCAACHSFETQQATDIEDRYWVHPVKLPQDFVPDARFDHVAHQVLRDNTSGELLSDDAACDTCHSARQSKSANDLLMPAMTTCYECHGDRTSGAQVSLACIDCHEYHPRRMGADALEGLAGSWSSTTAGVVLASGELWKEKDDDDSH